MNWSNFSFSSPWNINFTHIKKQIIDTSFNGMGKITLESWLAGRGRMGKTDGYVVLFGYWRLILESTNDPNRTSKCHFNNRANKFCWMRHATRLTLYQLIYKWEVTNFTQIKISYGNDKKNQRQLNVEFIVYIVFYKVERGSLLVYVIWKLLVRQWTF